MSKTTATCLLSSPLSFIQAKVLFSHSSYQKISPDYDLMETISRCLVLDREDRCLGSWIAPGTFHSDFEAFCKAALDKLEVISPLSFEWFQLNKSLCIRGRTLEECCRTAGAGQSVSSNGFKNKSSNSFSGRFEDTIATVARRLAVTRMGLIDMAASRARKGDVVCVLSGCSIPVLLREQGG